MNEFEILVINSNQKIILKSVRILRQLITFSIIHNENGSTYLNKFLVVCKLLLSKYFYFLIYSSFRPTTIFSVKLPDYCCWQSDQVLRMILIIISQIISILKTTVMKHPANRVILIQYYFFCAVLSATKQIRQSLDNGT